VKDNVLSDLLDVLKSLQPLKRHRRYCWCLLFVSGLFPLDGADSVSALHLLQMLNTQ